MSKVDRFFRGMAMVCLGVILGFLISPIKQGIRVTIGSNNRDSELLNQYGFLEDEVFDEDLDEMEEFEDEEFDEEPDFETPDDEEEVPF
ncbi:MAG: hypothetical protein Q4F79_04275 [Eubacteriales bacterium]|nr:hypothetical protein [Eubacteriales bacterium]